MKNHNDKIGLFGKHSGRVAGAIMAFASITSLFLLSQSTDNGLWVFTIMLVCPSLALMTMLWRNS